MGELGLDVRIILQFNLKICDGADWIQLAQCTVAGSCEHSYELPGSIKGGRFYDQMNDYKLLKKVSVACS